MYNQSAYPLYYIRGFVSDFVSNKNFVSDFVSGFVSGFVSDFVSGFVSGRAFLTLPNYFINMTYLLPAKSSSKGNVLYCVPIASNLDLTAKPIDIEVIKSGKNVTVIIEGLRSDDPTQMFCKLS